jgi:hypothetical protein
LRKATMSSGSRTTIKSSPSRRSVTHRFGLFNKVSTSNRSVSFETGFAFFI